MSLKFKCDYNDCNHSFSRLYNLNRHISRKHKNSDISENCLLCRKTFQDITKLQEHLIIDHGPSEKFYEKESAFHHTVQVYRYNYDGNQLNFNHGQIQVTEDIKKTIRYEAAKKHLIKVSLVYICQMSMQDLSGEKIQTTLIPFRSAAFITNALRKSSMNHKIKKAFQEQENAFEEFCDSGSNWVFDRAVAFDIDISSMKPIVIGHESDTDSDSNDTDLDDLNYHKHRMNITNFKNKKFLFNPNNRDNKCFLRCLYYLLKIPYPFKKWIKTLNLKKISFPITIQKIKKFVKQNQKLNIKLNILFRSLDGKIFPLECGIGDGEKILTLLMLNQKSPKKNKKQIINHFLAVKDVNKYLSNQYKTYKNKICYENAFFCLNCFNKFTTETSLHKHQEICLINKAIKEIVEEGKIEFSNHHFQHQQDYIGFLDFECVLTPNSQRCSDCNSLRCKCDKSYSQIITHQEPIAFSFVVLNNKNTIIHEYTFAGENASDVLVTHLLECHELWLQTLLKTNIPIQMTHSNTVDYEEAQKCYMCKHSFSENDSIKCRDHDHYTGQYLGAACQMCNLLRQQLKELPIFLHNGSKYDFHFIIKALNKKKHIGPIKVLPYNSEHFRTISFKGFRFLDSLAFLQASLAQLSSDLANTSHEYKILKQTHLVKTNNQLDLEKFKSVLQKSFFPYEFCTSLKQMEETTKLPSKKHFYSQLQEKSISSEDHKFAEKVWKMFKCKNLIDYTKIYCKIDTILLAEIFQKFRFDMINFSGLDPSHYMSLPAFSFDSMLKFTNCKLDKLHDIDMVHFLESSIRGGVSFINTRHLKVEENTTEEIVYIDANVSLYYIHFIMQNEYVHLLFMFTESLRSRSNVETAL